MFIEENKCTGCMACKNVCPRNAIKVYVKNGFRYPEIIEDYCIGCNLCENVCPVINYKQELEKNIVAYACKNINEDIRMKSSSGGVFSLIANYIIENNGIVYGVAFNDKFEAAHIRVDNVDNLEKIRGSKYIQSNIGTTFKDARKDLNEGKLVLFTGTPCQIEGLKSFLGKEYDNLFLQDIICHGVPSEAFFKKYLDYKRNELGEIKSFSFRNKEKNGWNGYQVHIVGENKEEYNSRNEDGFMRLFLDNIDLRESCYDCSFKKKYRESDITLADLWGIKNICPEMNDEKGTSLVIINSKKGKELFDKISSKIVKLEINLEEAIKYNISMIMSVDKNPKRETFFDDLEKLSYEEIVKKY